YLESLGRNGEQKEDKCRCNIPALKWIFHMSDNPTSDPRILGAFLFLRDFAS
ncbi:MAG: hypothetical protein ACI8Z1_002906, partial [Candidatus Azotimanducaceae bacterium]